MKKLFFKILFVNLLILEILSFILIRFFYIEQPPKSYKQGYLPYFIDTEEAYTTWHYKNTTTHHIGPKWNVEYKFNSHGARDKERSEKSTAKRFLFLGDSYIEGYGIKQENRVSDLLEKSTGIECINLAVSGIGQTQMSLIYNDLGAKFSHDVLFVSFYPFNDFRENDFKNREKYYSNRYRPYRTKDSTGNYLLTYFLNKAEESEYYGSKFSTKGFFSLLISDINAEMAFAEKVKTIFFNFTYTGALLKGATERLNHIANKKEKTQNSELEKPVHHLEHTKKEDWEILEYELSQIKQMAGNRPVVLLLIPHPTDFAYRNSAGAETKVQTKAKELSTKLNLKHIDFLELLPATEVKKLYIKNDDHWSAYGNKKAHDIVVKKLSAFKLNP